MADLSGLTDAVVTLGGGAELGTVKAETWGVTFKNEKFLVANGVMTVEMDAALPNDGRARQLVVIPATANSGNTVSFAAYQKQAGWSEQTKLGGTQHLTAVVAAPASGRYFAFVVEGSAAVTSAFANATVDSKVYDFTAP